MGEWREIVEWDWVLFGSRGKVLHAVGELTNADTVDVDWVGEGRTECGLTGKMFIPGIFTRMGAARCKRCCDRTGMPQGKGSPKNVDECHPVAEARHALLPSPKEAA